MRVITESGYRKTILMYWIVYYQQLLKWKKHSYWFSLIVWQTGRSSMIWPVVKDMNVNVPDTLVQFRPFSNAKNEMQTRSRVGFSDVTVVENYPLNKVKSLEVLKIGRREYFYSWSQTMSLSDIFPVILSVQNGRFSPIFEIKIPWGRFSRIIWLIWSNRHSIESFGDVAGLTTSWTQPWKVQMS